MIREIWQYLTTPVAFSYVRNKGFLKEAIAMAARARRCRRQWDKHYRYCEQTIVNAAKDLDHRHTVLIIGAGSLRDVPLDYLARHFEQVLLVDLVFLKAARRQAAVYTNVQLIEHDVTESLEDIFDGDPSIHKPSRWLDDEQVDLVVSLNLITQLPLIPVRQLIVNNRISEHQADEIGRKLIRAHLDYLQRFPGRVCLIADRESVEYNVYDEETDRLDTWWEVEAPSEEESWDWELIPFGEGRANRRQINRVAVSIL
ncbi:class I SAM-dependent methyltransferase [Thiomicrorhabdus sp. 6S3-12]|uniref:class I SAM-dependent methyltransferase n=1 Tax=Thiomicrorhabdus sp. 6S3-12 TaxID=2819681 RepID=UPI001AAC85E0|nr:class I SAM-dependent methyltransferase [Thiomicrorhabdus sp. 6S3-12]MBO1924317.1 class I SAM-dependent methyltransferase [Thiomicrorhabdus sp. 6S3-12]